MDNAEYKFLSLDKKLNDVEHQLKFLAEAYKHVHNKLVAGVKVEIDQNFFRPMMTEFHNKILSLEKLRNEIRQDLKEESVTGTLKFMAKRLHELEQAVSEIKEKGVKKQLQLDLTLDGYEMVRKKAIIPDPIPDGIIPEDIVRNLLDSLSTRESQVIIHRYGLFRYKAKTLAAIGKILGISSERIRELQQKALRKMRHPCQKNLVDALTHMELKKDITME